MSDATDALQELAPVVGRVPSGLFILTACHGPDETGQVTKDFGARRGPAGWRLLNVAVTRARYRAEIVSSIRADDIPESVTGDGVQYLRHYLTYAAEAGLPTTERET